ncbi:unknown [Lactococcus phage 712]|uniref:Uncharacterized protein n=2 Tax=Skunavirus sv712 TaxID=213769 RepID=Q09WV3_9CAUD|nr:DUF1660 domain-containing protein [Lactococcus phage 712]AAC63030.1 unknown [Lactococcus phage 712]ABB77568.1 unknown [Lactococcus phage 712]
MKLKCKLFGHKFDFNPAYDIRPHCTRCGWQDYSLDESIKQWIDKELERF